MSFWKLGLLCRDCWGEVEEQMMSPGSPCLESWLRHPVTELSQDSDFLQGKPPITCLVVSHSQGFIFTSLPCQNKPGSYCSMKGACCLDSPATSMMIKPPLFIFHTALHILLYHCKTCLILHARVLGCDAHYNYFGTFP